MTQDLQNYRDAIDFLMGRINYERLAATQYSARDLKLDRMRALLRSLDDPQQAIPVVHVAGTKGKGSTAMMIASVLAAAGYRTGLFTSPHLSRLEERMTVNGRLPTEGEVLDLVRRIHSAVQTVEETEPELGRPTYFEILTAMGWLYFRDQQSDIIVLEVGLGGRLDSTNICHPAVTVITSISYDHMHLLGSTLREIAGEKAGILKQGVPLINGATQVEPLEAIRRIAAERSVPIVQLGDAIRYEYRPRPSVDSTQPPSGELTVTVGGRVLPDVSLPLLGAHQGHNAALAIAAVTCLEQQGWRLPAAAIYDGLQRVNCPVRMEIVRQQPLTILDAAHNMASIRAFGETIDASFPNRRKGLIFATTRDKPLREMLEYLAPRFEFIVLTRYLNNPRGVAPEELAAVAAEVSGGRGAVAATPKIAWQTARGWAGPEDVIGATGSFFIAAELRELLRPAAPTPPAYAADLPAAV